MFYLWRRIDEYDRRHLWNLYGWFCGLILCGSCFGIVTWSAWMQVIVNLLSGNDPTPLAAGGPRRFQRLIFWASASRWRVVYVVTYAIEFLCLSTAKLMVLRRMMDFTGNKSRLWVAGARFVLACVVLGNTVGVAGNIAAAVAYYEVSSFELRASDFWAVNNSVVGTQIETQAFQASQSAYSITSVQSFSEVAVLLLIVALFAVAGVACSRRLRSQTGRHTEASSFKLLRTQIVATTVVVFVAFLLRSVYSTMSAVADKMQDTSVSCPDNREGRCNASCFNAFTHMVGWMNRTPQFQLMVVFISSPLTLLVALWGMTSQRILISMRNTTKLVPMLFRSESSLEQVQSRSIADSGCTP
jgi:hypothetical protein